MEEINEQEKRYNCVERDDNEDVFNKTILPELKKLYKYKLLNKHSQHNRFTHGKNIVDYFPRRKRLCHINQAQWFTVENNEEIMSRIVFLLNRK